jgi:hypothetical protein
MIADALLELDFLHDGLLLMPHGLGEVERETKALNAISDGQRLKVIYGYLRGLWRSSPNSSPSKKISHLKRYMEKTNKKSPSEDAAFDEDAVADSLLELLGVDELIGAGEDALAEELVRCMESNNDAAGLARQLFATEDSDAEDGDGVSYNVTHSLPKPTCPSDATDLMEYLIQHHAPPIDYVRKCGGKRKRKEAGKGKAPAKKKNKLEVKKKAYYYEHYHQIVEIVTAIYCFSNTIHV